VIFVRFRGVFSIGCEASVTVSDLHATVCHVLRIDGTKEVQTPNGKPARLIDGGQPVRELFGEL